MIDHSFFGATVSRIFDANFLVFGIPLDFSSSYRFGSSKGPKSIRNATSNKLYNSYTEASLDIKEKWKIFDGGDIEIDTSNLSIDNIAQIIIDLISNGNRLENYILGKIDWLENLSQNNRLKEYFD